MSRNKKIHFITTIFLILFFCDLSFSQIETWEHTYGGDSGEWAYFIINTIDDGYLIGGCKDDVDPVCPAWLLKINNIGQVQWQKYYWEWPFGTNFNDAKPTNDGGAILAGSRDDGLGNRSLWVVKIDDSGQIQWQRSYDIAQLGISIEILSDGYIIFCTDSLDITNYSLVKINFSGDLIWAKSYSAISLEMGERMIKTSTGDFVMIGKSQSFSNNDDIWVLKVNSAGNILWQKRFPTGSNEEGIDIKESIEGGNSYYILTGTYTDSLTGNVDILVIKIDANGNIVWQKKYGGSSSDKGRHIEILNDGYLIKGESNSFDPNSNTFVMKISTSGLVDWFKMFGTNEANWFNSSPLIKTSDNGILFSAYLGNVILLKTDLNGNLDQSCSTMSYAISSSDTNIIAENTNATEQIIAPSVSISNFPVNISNEADTLICGCTKPIFAGVQSVSDDNLCSYTGIRINWQAPSSWGIGAATTGTYEIRRFTDSNCSGSYDVIATSIPANVLTYTDTTANPGVIYYYQVIAENNCNPALSSAGTVSCSPGVSDNQDVSPCPNVGNTLNASKSGSNVYLQWNSVSCSDLSNYRVYAAASYNPASWDVIGNPTTNNFSAPLSSTYVAYKVLSVDQCGNISSY